MQNTDYEAVGKNLFLLLVEKANIWYSFETLYNEYTIENNIKWKDFNTTCHLYLTKFKHIEIKEQDNEYYFRFNTNYDHSNVPNEIASIEHALTNQTEHAEVLKDPKILKTLCFHSRYDLLKKIMSMYDFDVSEEKLWEHINHGKKEAPEITKLICEQMILDKRRIMIENRNMQSRNKIYSFFIVVLVFVVLASLIL
jgi:hypothetical protein